MGDGLPSFYRIQEVFFQKHSFVDGLSPYRGRGACVSIFHRATEKMKTSLPGYHEESNVVYAAELPKIQLLELPASVLQLRGDEYLLDICGLPRCSLPATD